MPVVEVATWTASEAYLEGPEEILKPTREFFKKTTGWESFHYGVSLEDGSTFYLFLAWETLAAHKALIGTPGYPQDTGLIAAMNLSEPTSMNHIEFNHDVLPAFNAPVTEISLMTLKEGKTKDDLYSILDVVASKLNAVHDPKYGQVAWGQSLEAPDKFYLVIGWESVKAHHDAMKDPAFVPISTDIRATVTSTICHAKLNELKV